MSEIKLSNHPPKKRVELARDINRPKTTEFIKTLFDNFFEIHGDRTFSDDRSIICGLAEFYSIPITVAGNVKAKTVQGNIDSNFGMASPEGYRKFIRVIKQAEKFSRPIITFIDTPGAYPGIGAEERGQGEAIAKCLYTLSNLKVPVISVVTGEGGSGGALALGLADKIIMLENSIYSILSPEGFAAILWKDSKRADEASEIMKLTAKDLYDFKIADRIIREPYQGAGFDPQPVMIELKKVLKEEMDKLRALSVGELLKRRYKKYRNIGL